MCKQKPYFCKSEKRGAIDRKQRSYIAFLCGVKKRSELAENAKVSNRECEVGAFRRCGSWWANELRRDCDERV
jgi:hypothetical protein